jgi:hypothetical protein
MMNLCVFSGTKNLGCAFASSFEAASELEAKAMGGLVAPPDRDPFAFCLGARIMPSGLGIPGPG